MPTRRINRPTFLGFGVQTMTVAEPRVLWFPVDAASAIVRWGDPVKQVAGGAIQRCTPADTALLGFAATGQDSVLPTSIAQAPLLTDASNRPLVSVYLADEINVFTGECYTAPTQALVLQAHDLTYALLDADAPTPVITTAGTAGATTYSYTVTAGNGNGETLAGTAGQTTTGNANLSAANYNTVTIPALAGSLVGRATYFNVYRNGAFIQRVPVNPDGATVFNDTGYVAATKDDGLTAPPAVNMTGWLVNNTASVTGVVQVREIDTRPQQPFVNIPYRQGVMFRVPPGKSQINGVMGS